MPSLSRQDRRLKMGENERYIMCEFQDSNGNIVYWHTDARVVWLPDGTSLYTYMDADVTDEQINAILA